MNSQFNYAAGQTLCGGVRQAFAAHYQRTPSAAGAASVKAATALAGAPATATTGITQPDVPRTVSITGNQAGITGNVVVTGTSASGATIADTIAADGTNTVNGVKAFATITSIQFPAQNAGGDTISVGRGSGLGLNHRLRRNTVLVAHLNNVREGTLPTVTVHATDIERNTVTLNSALSGNVVDVFYLVTGA